MRRKPGAIVGVEASVLAAGAALHARGCDAFHGYLLAGEMRDGEAARRLVGHGTLYKALDRLQNAGLLSSAWEDPELAATEGRPRRRLYSLTAEGYRALAKVETPIAAPVLRTATRPAEA